MYLLLRAFWELAKVQYFLAFRDLPAIYAYVGASEYSRRQSSPRQPIEICSAIDAACIWFWKEVSCLQRSAATTRLLRENGVSADMVIGAQSLPFKAHAWVEVNGQVINDKPYVREMYRELDRF